MKRFAIFCMILFAINVAGFQSLYASEPIRVVICNDSPTVRFAADELVRYLGLMTGQSTATIIIESKQTTVDSQKTTPAEIRLGLYSDFGKPHGVKDPACDDAFSIEIDHSRGFIAGSNPRSVLFGVYRFLEKLGCRWVRPGKSNELIPKLALDKVANGLTCKLTDKATYRFRGVNNCGIYSFQELVDKIDWCAKMGMNMFFCEFLFSRHFYARYYERGYPTYLLPDPKSDAEIWVHHRKNIDEIKKRGMLYHAVGHGWTGLVVGAKPEDCDHDARPTPDPDKVKHLALYKGKRSIENGPTFTDLCYGNPETFHRLVTLVADYAQNHPEVDYLHFWLDDRMNNSCECPLCKDLKPSEVYVRLLNAVDAELTKRKLNTKIVFLTYIELFWPPKKEHFVHPERFVFMYAPISRNYREPYFLGDTKDVVIPEYGLNQYVLPNNMELRSALLAGWQKVFSGPAFVFDYHMIWHHYNDFGYYDFAKIMTEDIRRLPHMGMQGYVSCQVVNSTFPHGFPMYLHAKMLWNPKYDFDAIAKEFFQASFGHDWEKVLAYFQQLSAVSPFVASRP
ncbi:MAG: DUF4838 domain-containing protein, partial [Planctomycetia bacterium]|nr:DUF4838 domain-containing protein [Planctomycetia bacterium]